MSALSVQPVFPTFTDSDGSPLDEGYVWIGVAGSSDPIANTQTAYWDAALTQVVTQPVRTRGGYPLNAGAIGRLYVAGDYSILVRNRNGYDLYSAPNATERISSELVTFLQAGTNAVPTTVQAKLRETVSVKDFGAVGDGVADDTAAIQAAIAAADSGSTVCFPSGTYKVTSSITTGGKPLTFAGAGLSSVITGSGFAIFSLTAGGSSVTDLKIVASAYSALTVGIDIDNGASGVNNFTVQRCTILGFFQNPYVGVGIRMYFALKGVVNNCVIQYWDKGVQLLADGVNAKPNSNAVTENKIRQNTVGVYVDTVDDLYLLQNTLESNETCLKSVGFSGTATVIQATCNHFEATVGASPNNVDLTNTSYFSTNNSYYASAAFKDIVVNTSPFYTGTIVSNGDYISGAGGITNNSIGVVYVQDPLPNVNRPTTGSGKVIFRPNTDAVTPTLASPWVNDSAVWSVVKYYKDGWGRVNLSGRCKGGTTGDTVFTLPAGFRPSKIRSFVVAADDAYGRLNVTDTGLVVLSVGTGTTFLSLDGVSFFPD